MPAGRPLLFETPEQMQVAVDDYFEMEERPTLAGLALHIGMDRKSLYNYRDRDEYFHIVKKARDRVEKIYEERAIYHPQPTGVIFALKNMDWSDKPQPDPDESAYRLFSEWLKVVTNDRTKSETD